MKLAIIMFIILVGGFIGVGFDAAGGFGPPVFWFVGCVTGVLAGSVRLTAED